MIGKDFLLLIDFSCLVNSSLLNITHAYPQHQKHNPNQIWEVFGTIQGLAGETE